MKSESLKDETVDGHMIASRLDYSRSLPDAL